MSPAKYDILLLDDGELTEIRAAAHALGASVHADMDAPGTPVEWPLVVSSTRYLEQLESIAVNLSAKRVVVLDQLSQTLRARMRRARVDFFLCRPVHPEALRLLLLHCLYRGPERRQRRVAVGAPVRFRSGFRRGRGILADLSDSGCRILCPPDTLSQGQKLLVFLPKPGRPGRTFYVRAEVVRALRRDESPHEIALRFYSVGAAAQRRIDELIAHHMEGPAVFREDGSEPQPSAPPRETRRGAAPAARPGMPYTPGLRRDELPGEAGHGEAAPGSIAGAPVLELDSDTPALFEGEQTGDPRFDTRFVAEAAPPTEPTPRAEAECARVAETEPKPIAETVRPTESASRAQPARDDERRREPRRAFHRQVVALDRSATRILIGRDLSVGGMRVDTNAALVQAKSFRLAIHVGEEELPLVVRARVSRDDGDDGILLRFEKLGFAAQEHLRKSLRELPILAPSRDGSPQRVLVTEILDEPEEGAATG